jgi:phosphatidylserine/phosphatidylglycerophosphate/cardiolipin synthase-like enzyme
LRHIDVRTLTDGGQTAEAVAGWIAAFLAPARETLDLALYDVRVPGDAGELIAAALHSARDRGVRIRIAFNLDDTRWSRRGRFFPPPPDTQPEILRELGVPVKGIPGEPDLMHHKYVVRDGDAVWTGSMNWTTDSFTRQENVLATVTDPEVVKAYARNFAELWESGRVDDTGDWEIPGVWFTPGRGPELSQRIASAIGAARTRVRIASPVLTAAAVLGTLAEVLAEGRVDVRGVSDGSQVANVFHQWRENPNSRWKGPVLAEVLTRAHWSGKPSTPYAPGTVHDYMHAKVTVADDHVFLGSFNLSRSGELNAENVLEVHDRALADRMADFIDEVRERYPAIEVPSAFE